MTKTADVWSLAFSPDGGLLAVASLNANVRVWDTASERPVFTLRDTRFTVSAGFAGAADRLLVCNLYGPALLHRLRAGSAAVVSRGGGYSLTAAVSPDGGRFVRSEHPTLHCRDTADGRTVWTAGKVGHRSALLLFTADGARVVAVLDRASVLDAADGREVGGFDIAPGRSVAHAAAVSPDGRRLAVRTSTGALRVYDTAVGGLVFEESVTPAARSPLQFTPDGATLGTGSADGGRIDFWDAGSWTRRPSLDFGGGAVTALAFSPDGLLGAAGSRGRVAVWDTA